MGGGPGWSEHRRQLPPSAARRCHEGDRCQTFTVPSSSAAAVLRAYDLRRRDQPPEQRPQLLWHQPLDQLCHVRFSERSHHRKRRLSRRSLAITVLASPWANRSAVCSCSPSRNCGRWRPAHPLWIPQTPVIPQQMTSRQPLRHNEFNFSHMFGIRPTVSTSVGMWKR